ncbi:wax ester/triacylglycerol synthase family O-acyltransferase [Nocardia thailandica]|uniref:Diacylglycerol O-acyltransferase n=1 Tax=Nocardia thailandica TaxID=257275 RepID=A0ABW6PUC4_9NOCA
MSLERLSATDATWLSLESPDMPMHVAYLMEFSCPDGHAEQFVLRWLAAHSGPVPAARPWNLVPVAGRLAGALALVREVEEIDPAHHVRHWHLPEGADRDDLTRLATRIHTTQLDLRRPPWELHFVTGAAPDRFAVLLKAHHSLVDGVSLVRVVAESLTTDSARRDTAPFFTVGPAAAPPRRSPVAAVRGFLAVLLGVLLAAWDAVRRVLGLPATGQHTYRQPPSILDGPITGARGLALRRYDLAEFKAVAKASGCTVNDLLLYLVSTALRDWLGAHGELPAATLTTGVPTDLREGDDQRAGTRAGLMFTALGTDLADPAERLAAVKTAIDGAKRQFAALAPEAVIGYGLATTIPWILGLRAGRTRTAASHPMGISNLPGPRRPLYWDGARLTSMYPISLLMHGNSLNVTCTGYDGALYLGILTAADRLPPVEEFAAALDRALDGAERPVAS